MGNRRREDRISQAFNIIRNFDLKYGTGDNGDMMTDDAAATGDHFLSFFFNLKKKLIEGILWHRRRFSKFKTVAFPTTKLRLSNIPKNIPLFSDTKELEGILRAKIIFTTAKPNSFRSRRTSDISFGITTGSVKRRNRK